MDNNNDLFDKKMKAQFKKETIIIPEDIDKEFENILKIEGSKGRLTMGKLKKFGITAASLICATTLVMQTALAQDIVNKIVKSLSIGGLTVYENKDQGDIWARDMPEAAKGKVFDAEGNVVEKINSENMDYLYNADGAHVWVDDDGIILTDEEMEERIEQNRKENEDVMLNIADINEIGKHVNFNVHLPEYIPEGYEFTYAEADNYEKTGLDKSYWCGLYYENKESKDKFFLQLTYVDGIESAETFSNNIEKGSINGSDAIISDDAITWVSGNVRYSLFMQSLTKEEGIKVAESIK